MQKFSICALNADARPVQLQGLFMWFKSTAYITQILLDEWYQNTLKLIYIPGEVQDKHAICHSNHFFYMPVDVYTAGSERAAQECLGQALFTPGSNGCGVCISFAKNPLHGGSDASLAHLVGEFKGTLTEISMAGCSICQGNDNLSLCSWFC